MHEDPPQRPAHLQLLAVSWNFGWPVAAGVMLGHWLDVHLQTSPLGTLGLGIGALGGAVWRLIVLSERERKERNDGDSPS